LRWMNVAREPIWIIFKQVAPIAMTVSLIASTVAQLAAQMQRKLQEKNRLLEQAVEKGSARIEQQEQEMTRAHEIQKNLLPKDLPQLAGVEIVSAWQPARIVGGDYFDVIRLDDNRLGLCIGDVAGKGITAALLMANLQAAFRAFAVAEASPSVVCSKLNEFICGNVAPGKFITFFYAILNPSLRTITFENAGHCPALLVKKSGQAEFLRGDGAVLGVLPEWVYKDYSVTVNTGDRLLLYTDGVTEAENQHAEQFGDERLLQSALAVDGSAANTRHHLMEAVTEFCGNNFRDDVTVLVASIG
jgi:phosphoserine phosphatase RsbU/P